MYIQPINNVNLARTNHLRKLSQNPEPVEQPNFKGFKGFMKGTAVGAGLTAGGVALVGGLALVPIFVPYIVINGILGGASGHMIEGEAKKKNY